MGLRTGLVSHVAGEKPPTLAHLAAMAPDEMAKAVDHLENARGYRLAAALVRCKNFAMIPAAVASMPYLRMKKYTGLYLYCLARKRRAS
jgi:hypothetical protein